MERSKKEAAEIKLSAADAAKKVMQLLKIDKVFVSADGYIFPNEADARAYVGKDGAYDTITAQELNLLKNESAKGSDVSSETLIDKHKEEE